MNVKNLLKQINPGSYLSVDNGHGILLSKDEVNILEKYQVNFYNCNSISELLMYLEEIIDENAIDDEELEAIVTKLQEMHYYNETHK